MCTLAVFAKETRNMSPRQHIAMVCGKNARDVNACCYSDYPNNTQPNTNNGIRRIVGQWSAAYDILPVRFFGNDDKRTRHVVCVFFVCLWRN
jgi:hypothetical protein